VAEIETAQQLASRFDGRAATYDDGETHRQIADAVAEFVDPAGVHDVLDTATGTGLVLRALKPRLVPDAGLSGVDLSNGMLEVARAQLPTATFVAGDATELPFANASFDLITCVTGIHLMPNPAVALLEWARVLKPNGRIVIGTFTSIMGWGHLVSVPDEAPRAGLKVLRSKDWTVPADSGFPDVVIVELAKA
jgi:ubiquinone/menaquinone biosynthesis C-methylase UbiE